MMEKLNYLNVGCGSKFHNDWYNIDMTSNAPEVMIANLLKGIPFDDNNFDVVYHSQVLEHIPREKALAFMQECYRVLKPGGIVRVVVPDLENIVNEYKRLLERNLNDSDETSRANYDWIMLELYDQTVRNYEGGQMAEYLRQPFLINEDYVLGRTGYVGRNTRHSRFPENSNGQGVSYFKKFKRTVKRSFRYTRTMIHHLHSQAFKIGKFRLGGEVHMWMYDRFSLTCLLEKCGFIDISLKSPYESSIPNWADYELDIKGGQVYDPTSLFMEARKTL